MSNDVDEDQLLAESSSDDSSSSEEEDNQKQAQRASAASFFQKAADNQEDDSSDSDDQDEQMEVDEDGLQTELTIVNDKLAAEPYSYDLHLEKIRILKALGELDRLRDAREKMSKMYPLSPTLWIEWLQDEQKMASVATQEERDYLFSLMERAIKDYSSVEVWLDYINLCLSRMGDENGIPRCRDVFERALGNCGLNVAMGSLIWDTYRDFEAALLSSMKTEEQQIEQEKRYISLCKRQLAVPLLDMKNTFKQIKERIEIDENFEATYKAAFARLSELENWEAKLVQNSEESQKLQVFIEYIEEEKKMKSNPARIQCLYERAITDSPLSFSLWLDYIDYLSKHLKIPELILQVAERASRNCPWILSVWMKYLWAIETFGIDEDPATPEEDKIFDKVKSVFEAAIVYCGTGDQVGTLWLKYLEFLRRRIDYGKLDNKKVEIFRKTFTVAETHLLQMVQEPNDFVSQILQFQARFEATIAKAMTEEVREMWKNIFQRGYGQNFRVWSQYITQEIKHGADVKKIRSELSRAMSQVKDDPQAAADLWLNFERDFGNLITLTNAETKIAKDLEKVVLKPDFNYEKPRDKGRKRKFEEKHYAVPAKKGKNFKTIDSVDGVKKAKGGDTPDTFKMPAIPKARPAKGASKNDDKMGLDPEDGKTKMVSKSEPIDPPPPGPVKHDSSKDPRTVFVSNLDFKVDEDALKTFFAECGSVEEIRLVRDFKGRSKGFGYVVFENDNCLEGAMKLDRKTLGERPVFVSKCDPDKATRQPQFKYSNNLETNKIFVKGLPFSMSQDALKTMFEEFGTLKDCRLVTHRNGNSKGIAYIDYQVTGAAAAAILKTDGSVIDGHSISVAISNPPTKNAVRSLQFTSSTRNTDPSQRRERNTFVPRSLQVHPSTTGKVEEASSKFNNETDKKPVAKSNDEFRKMFMKK